MLRNIVTLIFAILFFQSCMEQKEPVALNGVAPLVGSSYFSITGDGPNLADGIADSLITIEIIDGDGIAIVGIVPTFRATDCRNGNLYGSCSPTDTNGHSTCSLTSTCAGVKTLTLTYPAVVSGGSVEFLPGPKSRVNFITLPARNVLVGEALAINPVIQTQDEFQNPVRNSVDTISLSAFSDSSCTAAASGNLTATALSLNTDGSTGEVIFTNVKYDKWGDIFLKVSSGALLPSCFGPILVRQIVSEANSDITGTNTIIADGIAASNVTILIKDTLNNPIVGFIPIFSATNTGGSNIYGICSETDGSGTSTCTLKSKKAETKLLSVLSPLVFSGGTVDFVAGAVDATFSMIDGSGTTVADGTAQSDVTIVLKDIYGNPVSGTTPTFSVGGTGNTLNPCSATDIDGISICSVKSTKAENKTLTLDTPIIKTGADLLFVHGPVETLTFTTDPSTPNLTDLTWGTQPVVSLVDVSGNIITAPTTVFLDAFSDSGHTTSATGIFSYTPTVSVAGVVTFSGIKYDSVETIYLKASTAGKVADNPLAIIVNQRPELTVTENSYTENSENIGGTLEQIDIVLVGDNFNAAVNDDLVAQGKATVSNIPIGMSAIIEVVNSTTVKVLLSGNATSHLDSDDLSNITINFLDGAFSSFTASEVLNVETTGISFDFIDPYFLTYSGDTYNEVVSNTGAIENSLVVDLVGTTFDAAVNDDLVLQGKVTISNLPAGLTLEAKVLNLSQVQLTLLNQAGAHEVDIANLTINFLDLAFLSGKAAGVLNSIKSNLIIDFLPPAVLAYDLTTFSEALTNDGEISNLIVVTLTNDTFVSDLNGKFSAPLIPDSLSLDFVRNSDTQLTFALTGSADSHLNSDDTTIDFEFLDTAFVNNTAALNVTNYQQSFLIDFRDPPVLTYVNTSVVEGASNDGEVSEVYVINLIGDTFAADPTLGITSNFLPTGLSLSVTRNSDIQIEVGFSGKADSHLDIDDIGNLEFIFNGTAFEGVSDGTLVSGHTNSALGIDFNDPPALTYDLTTFTEMTSNTGEMITELTVTLVGDEFSFGLDTKININGVPSGLTPLIIRDSPTQMRFSLTGNALNHEVVDNINNISITFLDEAFVNTLSSTDVTGYTRADIGVTFLDAASLAYDVTTLNESLSNDGSISEKMTITLTNDIFEADLVGDITTTNLPTGLVLDINRLSDTQVELSFTGNALAHADINDVGNLEINFLNNAFVGNSNSTNVSGSVMDTGVINFIDPASLSYSSTTLSEVLSNDGSITDSLIITLTGDTFVGLITDLITPSFVPLGMTAQFVRNSSTQITMTLNGSADNHQNGDDISNLTITFSDGIFVNNSSASSVTNYEVSDRVVDFNDSATLSYSGTTFTEDLGNTGATSDALIINLVGDTFATDVTSKITTTFVPIGLVESYSRDSATQVTLTFSNSATNHEDINDISNLSISFTDGAFENTTTASNVSNYELTSGVVDFNDKASLSYSGTTFSESNNNDGTTSDSIIITLSNDTFVAEVDT